MTPYASAVLELLFGFLLIGLAAVGLLLVVAAWAARR